LIDLQNCIDRTNLISVSDCIDKTPNQVINPFECEA